MPPFAMSACLERVHQKLKHLDEGEVAAYIPELQKADPDLFGLSIATLDGHVYGAGDDEETFTIQSISKAFVYGLALDDHGIEFVEPRVGVEPSGDAFNSIVMDERHNRPPNPMVNAGAIVCTSMVRGDGLEERRARILETFRRYAGRPLEIDWAVAESERRTGHRNRAIAYLELSSGMIAEPVDEHLDLYFEQCSILVTAHDLAVMAATLANGGVNPLTGERALKAEHVSKVLSVMATCGMYDWSGEWMFRIGLPAKSGVGGGIIAVLPGQVGIGTFSPRLDDHGNSCRGVRACESLTTELSLHLLDATATASPVVNRRYFGSQISSKRLRRADERHLLEQSGSSITVLQLQGDLYFATAERLVRAVEQAVDDADVVILDGRRLGRATAGALSLLGELHANVTATGVTLLMAGAPDALIDALEEHGDHWDPADLPPDVDRALERAEDLVLAPMADRPAGARVDRELGLHELDILRELDAESRDAIGQRLLVEDFAPGAVILEEGSVADRLCYLAAGSATVRITLGEDDGRTKRLRTFGPGTVFGEAAALEGGVRSASVTADEACTVLALTTEGLQDLATRHPQVHARLLAALGRNLSEMLRKAVDEIRALDE
jgi:glutaminase